MRHYMKRMVVLAIMSVLASCAGKESNGLEGEDPTGGQSPVDEVLPPGADILGSCTVHLHTCELYYRTESSGLTEEEAHEQCLTLEEDVFGNPEDWFPYEGCPTEHIESACRFQNSIVFEYLGHEGSVSDRQTICSHSGGSFIVF